MGFGVAGEREERKGKKQHIFHPIKTIMFGNMF
jgi:hypothetical protein